jgi:hypothetical protein
MEAARQHLGSGKLTEGKQFSNESASEANGYQSTASFVGSVDKIHN